MVPKTREFTMGSTDTWGFCTLNSGQAGLGFRLGELCLDPSLMHTFLALQSQTLVSLTLEHVEWTVTSLISHSKLESLNVSLCHLENWDILCESFHSLKPLSLTNISSSDISAFPRPACLETLKVFY